MKLKHVLWVLAGIVAVVSIAAGVAVFVDYILGKKQENCKYIECDCDPEEA